MAEWIDGWMAAVYTCGWICWCWLDVQVGRINRHADGWMNKSMGEWIDPGWLDVWMDDCMYGDMNGWMDG